MAFVRFISCSLSLSLSLYVHVSEKVINLCYTLKCPYSNRNFTFVHLVKVFYINHQPSEWQFGTYHLIKGGQINYVHLFLLFQVQYVLCGKDALMIKVRKVEASAE